MMKTIRNFLTVEDLKTLRTLAKTIVHHTTMLRGRFDCGTAYGAGSVFDYHHMDRKKSIPDELYQRFMVASKVPQPFNGKDIHQFISYKVGGSNDPHKDWAYDIEFREQLRTAKKDDPNACKLYRVIALVDACKEGGELFVAGKEIKLNEGDAVAFRSELIEHEVKKVIAGDRMIFTIGFHHLETNKEA
jgi:hypothetical protein